MSLPNSRAIDEKRLADGPVLVLTLTDSLDDRDPDRDCGGDGRGSFLLSVRERFCAGLFCNDEIGEGERGGDSVANGEVGRGDRRWM